jgi:hypothetical protein
MKTECLSIPLTPVTLITYLPRGVTAAVAMVSFAEVSGVPDAEGITLVLFRVVVITADMLAERLTVPLKPFKLVSIIVTFLFVPCRIERRVMFAPILKPELRTVIVNPLLMELLLRELSCVSRLGM